MVKRGFEAAVSPLPEQRSVVVDAPSFAMVEWKSGPDFDIVLKRADRVCVNFVEIKCAGELPDVDRDPPIIDRSLINVFVVISVDFCQDFIMGGDAEAAVSTGFPKEDEGAAEPVWQLGIDG